MQNSEEWFDVVDEQDRPVGRERREHVHAERLRHRAVHVWVFGPDGRVLVQKRSALKDRHPLVWDSSASGHVEAGESYEASAVRETAEELGLDPVPELKLVGKVEACAETEQEFVCLYVTQHPGPFVCPVAEIERVEWMEPAALSKEVASRPEQFAPGFRYLWRSFAPRLGLG